MLRGGPPRAPAVIKHGKTHAQLDDHYYELCRGWDAQAAIAKSALAAMGPPRPDSPSNDFQREEMERRMKWAEYYASSSAALSLHHRRLAAGIINCGEPFERPASPPPPPSSPLLPTPNHVAGQSAVSRGGNGGTPQHGQAAGAAAAMIRVDGSGGGSGTDNDGDGVRKFARCGFCGASAGDEDEGFDLGSSAVVPRGAGPSSTSSPRATTLRECTRCKSVAYCSIQCQRKDYPNHKSVCRRIGKELEAKKWLQDRASAKPQKAEDEGKAHSHVADGAWRPTGGAPKCSPLPRKGVPAPTSHPRTSITPPIIDGAAANREAVVLHCDSEYSPACDLVGVYLYDNQRGLFFYDDDATSRLHNDIYGSDKLENWNALAGRGFHFQFPHNYDQRVLARRTGRGDWLLGSQSGEQFVEVEVPRARSKEFWEDPMSMWYMPPSELHGTWRDDTRKLEAKIAITPLEVLLKAAGAVPAGRPTPQKYLEAADFPAWDRRFVLHVDPRNCQVPLEWVDSVAGVYAPVEGKCYNGYPIWERQSTSVTMTPPVEACLAQNGIRLKNSIFENYRISVYKRDKSSPSLLRVTIRRGPKTCVILEASCVPEHMDDLLSDPSSLFVSPDEAFSTWKVKYYKYKMHEMHVAFTPEEFFHKAITLASLETGTADEEKEGLDAVEAGAGKKKKKQKKRKKKPPANSSPDVDGADNGLNRDNKQLSNDSGGAKNTNTPDNATPDAQPKPKKGKGKKKHKVKPPPPANELPESSVASKDPNEGNLAPHILGKLAVLVKADAPSNNSPSLLAIDEIKASEIDGWSIDDAFKALFEGIGNPAYPLWLSLEESATSPILDAVTPSDSLWLQSHISLCVSLLSERKRSDDLSALLGIGFSIPATSVATLLSSLKPGDRGDQFNNKIIKVLCSNCEITIGSKKDFHSVMQVAKGKIGKGTHRELLDSMKKASAEFEKLKPKKKDGDSIDNVASQAGTDTRAIEGVSEKVQATTSSNSYVQKEETKGRELEKGGEKVAAALRWYSDLLEKRMTRVAPRVMKTTGDEDDADSILDPCKNSSGLPLKSEDGETKVSLSSEEVAAALSNCETEDALAQVEVGVDLFNWDATSEWTVDITEKAHKWFQRHVKKDRALCERVIKRLTLLSTGRWPYVLCKPLKTKRIGNYGKKISLYETKIDAASRIIWEVALAFSPRRSKLNQSYCEQVIRVWDVVLDHDNLSRSIDQTIDRIEKSHLRGEDCAIFAKIERSLGRDSKEDKGTKSMARIPRVFPMSNEVTCIGATDCKPQNSIDRSRHFPPASEDPRQFTLLKFYELNAGAVKMLLDGQNENMDLPFTPGPKEHEIIHYQSDPQRSILLMGRSGTGKTTCLVFRMWASATTHDGDDGQFRQLFMTKNDVLCREVERSFKNMGLAWTKRKRHGGNKVTAEESFANEKVTKFMTSNMWLEALDQELPGQPFFTPQELEERTSRRKEKDTVTEGVEALLSGGMNAEIKQFACRQEMTFIVFKKLWRRVKSGSGSQLDCALVWREIKSFIKGSVLALHIDRNERSLPSNRFLNLDEYLALPRKQSRMDEAQRREVFDLYVSYEKLKKEGSYYDECDLVYNLAGRIGVCSDQIRSGGVLPIDSIFIDEVQDFTQAELYILAKLCRDPNNLFLAGDTAQSISLGVDFRFTDLRQIFYNSFGGLEPRLLQLSHNYRSHAGVLRLAACVVELLYFFFSNSLDRLPPDLGLFDGPRPVIMEVTSTADLVLMLEGAKRETSRIEFGAHQVILVRSEEAKQNLPEEFEVDRDWVMTVQQSKGLEFDDVLLYNFFSDSPAGDAWRVVSNYTKDDIDNYYADVSVSSSGVQKYEWDEGVLNNTRHLDFAAEKHKILETELKMLYTAITRARVNVFIAETDPVLSRPMFNYFQRRAVVDVVNKESGLSSVRVFGAMNNVEDWRTRGEYYLQNAEGERLKGCLSLAAKCFDKAGQPKRRDFALAYLAFAEIEEQGQSRKRGKQAVEFRAKLYNITEQLLEARDVGFLSKAALCLLRTGEHDGDAARMFELYARLSYAEDVEFDGAVTPPSSHQKKYLSYAGKIFMKCLQKDRGVTATDPIRCFACAGLYDDARNFINSPIFPVKDGESFKQLSHLCYGSGSNRDPICSFRRDFHESAECILPLKQCINTKAKAGCRALQGDINGFSAALALLTLPSDRIELLRTIEGSVESVLSNKPWASHVTFTRKASKEEKNASIPDVTGMLISELKTEKRYREAVDILEDRGFLLEAANMVEEYHLANQMEAATALRTKYVELMLLSKGWGKKKVSLAAILERDASADSEVDADTRYSALLSSALLAEDPLQLLAVVSKCHDSIMWQFQALRIAFKSNSVERLLADLPGSCPFERLTVIHKITKNLMSLGLALRKNPISRTSDDNLSISHVEHYFELEPNTMDPGLLKTRPVINSRLRDMAHSEKCDLPFSSGTANGFVQTLHREKMHFLIGRFIHNTTSLLLVKSEELASSQLQRMKSVKQPMDLASLRNYIHCLQLQLLFKESLTNHLPLLGAKQKGLVNKHRLSETSDVVRELIGILNNERRVSFILEDDDNQSKTAQRNDDSVIIIQRSAIDALLKCLNDTAVHSKKTDIMVTVSSWRLRSLSNDIDFANKALGNEILRLERNAKRHDLKGFRRPYYFINRKNQIFPRLWLWATESPHIMNSLSVVGRIIRTSSKSGLVSIPKIDQVAFLEVNAVSLFASLSLRYSEATPLSPPFFIPKKSYLQGLLNGQTGFSRCHRLQTFGVPLTSSLSEYCHKRFDKVFQDVVSRIEETAAIILSSNLLAPAKSDRRDLLRLERAICLSVFICCNSIIFFIAGKDMNVRDHENDFSVLPALPLQGKVKELVSELHGLFTRNQVPITTDGPLPLLPETFLDLYHWSDKLLRSSMADSYVLACLKQQSESQVNVCVTEDISQIVTMLATIPFGITHDSFTNRSLKSIDFLDNGEQIDDEEVDHGRQSEELNAVRVIARLAKHQDSTKKALESEVDIAIKYFQCWKGRMRKAIRLLKKWSLTRQSAFNGSRPPTNGHGGAGDDNNERCVLLELSNHLQDETMFRQHRDQARAINQNAIVDGIECTYCCIIYNPTEHNERHMQWEREGQRMGLAFPAFAQGYNMKRFGQTIDPDVYHLCSPVHNDQVMFYHNKLNEFSTVMARIMLGYKLLMQIIHECDEMGKSVDRNSSWYLSTGEECRALAAQLEKAQGELNNMGLIWSRQPSPQQYQRLTEFLYHTATLPQQVETLFLRKKDEEIDMKQSSNIESDGPVENEDDGDDDLIEGLVGGSYLNPSAIEFKPAGRW